MSRVFHHIGDVTSGQQLSDLTARLLRDEPALRSSRDFGPFVYQGKGGGPSLIIGDLSEIPLMPHVLNAQRDYRMALLARPADIVIVRDRDTTYEEYLASHLGISDVTYLEAPRSFNGPVAVAARKSLDLSHKLMQLADNGLTLNTYFTTQTTWRLAKYLGDAVCRAMHVCGPSPRLSQRVNDKLWFTDVTRQLIGKTATPPTMRGYNLAAAAAKIAYFARRSDRVVAKIPNSAGSAGNVTFLSADIATKSEQALRSMLNARLAATGWTGQFPILVGVWDSDVRCSPSVQLWVPHRSDGLPYTEGVFEQRTRNVDAAFIGASLSALPPAMQARLSEEAVMIATVFQALGYYGRCSFDAVIHSNSDGEDDIHWIECNGRWGGVSIPMTLAMRLNGGTMPEGFLVVQEYRKDLARLTTQDCLMLFDDLLFCKGHQEEGLIITSPPSGRDGLSVNLLGIGSTPHLADLLIKEAMSRLRSVV